MNIRMSYVGSPGVSSWSLCAFPHSTHRQVCDVKRDTGPQDGAPGALHSSYLQPHHSRKRHCSRIGGDVAREGKTSQKSAL